MARLLAAAIEELKSRRHPGRYPNRQHSTPIPSKKNFQDPENMVTTRKRARSQPPKEAPKEPTRVSKRLRGMTADIATARDNEALEIAEPATCDATATKSTKKRKLTKTTSANTHSTVEEVEESDVVMASQSTANVGEAESSRSAAPKGETVAAADSQTDHDATFQPAQAFEPLQQPTLLPPPFTGRFPAPVLIHGHPSLRVMFRNLCVYRHHATSPSEWQSQSFLQHITTPSLRLQLSATLDVERFIRLPNDLFGSITPEEETPLVNLMGLFFETYAIPDHPLPGFIDFSDPFVRVFHPKRLLWWKSLADYFNINSNLDKIYGRPANWHAVFHSLPTLAGLREFGVVTEQLGMKRGREKIHLELARRLSYMQRKGVIQGDQVWTYLKKGYEELREYSVAFDPYLEAAPYLGQNFMEVCSMCCIRPPFAGDVMQ
jgi:hypothetical protein